MSFSTPVRRGKADPYVLGETNAFIAFSPTATLAVDTIQRVHVGIDNISTTQGATNTVTSVTDSKGNTWNKIGEYTRSSGAAADGNTVAAFWSKITVAILTSDTITVNLSAPADAKCATVLETTVGVGMTVQVAGVTNSLGSGASPVVSLSGLPNVEHLYDLAMARETSGISGTFANYTLLSSSPSSNSGTAGTSQVLQSYWRILTGTGDTATGSGTGALDKAIIYYALEEVSSAVPPDGDPSNMLATVNGAQSVTLTWTRGSTNNTAVRVERAQESSPGSGAPGAYATVTTLGAAAVTYNDQGSHLSGATRYWWRVYETNVDGESDPSTDDATTRSLPTVTKVDPASSSVTIPSGYGAHFPFEVDAADVDGAVTIVWEDSVEGVLANNVESIDLDVDVDLPTLGVHTLTVTVTDSDGDTASTGWSLNVTVLGAGTKRLKREPMADIPVPYGVGFTERSLHFEDPANGNYVTPTFVLGDVTIRVDNGTRVNTTNLPTQIGATKDYDFVVEGGELEGTTIRIDFIDQSDPKAWVDCSLQYRTYGSALSFYTEPQPAVDSNGVVDSRVVLVVQTTLTGNGSSIPWGPAS